MANPCKRLATENPAEDERTSIKSARRSGRRARGRRIDRGLRARPPKSITAVVRPADTSYAVSATRLDAGVTVSRGRDSQRRRRVYE